jgi:hypothetical protein
MSLLEKVSSIIEELDMEKDAGLRKIERATKALMKKNRKRMDNFHTENYTGKQRPGPKRGRKQEDAAIKNYPKALTKNVKKWKGQNSKSQTRALATLKAKGLKLDYGMGNAGTRAQKTLARLGKKNKG